MDCRALQRKRFTFGLIMLLFINFLMNLMKKNLLKLIIADTSNQLNRSISFMKEFKKATGIDKAFIGISGGADSALCAYILKESGYQVTGLIMPSAVTKQKDLLDARYICSSLGIKKVEINLSNIIDSFKLALNEPCINRLAIGNLTARVRMSVLYAYSNQFNGIVAGTGDKSEYFLGYFTKHGDAGCDVFPILHMYKTQVQQALLHIGFSRIAKKAPSPGLWEGQTAQAELGIDYSEADCIIHAIIDNLPISAFSKKAVAKVGLAFLSTKHKRTLPSLLKQSDLDVFERRVSSFVHLNNKKR